MINTTILNSDMKNRVSCFVLIAQIAIPFITHSQSVTINPNDTKSLVTIQSNSLAISLPVLTLAQRDAIPTPQAGMQVYCTNCPAGVGSYNYNGSTWMPMFLPPASDLALSYSIGQAAQGGIVFFVDESGHHGLVASQADQSTSTKWLSSGFRKTGATLSGIYGGIENTQIIMQFQGNGSYAASLAANHNGSNFGDWYLPSLVELNLMYTNKIAIGGFSNAVYWSSTESTVSQSDPSINAMQKSFTNGAITSTNKNTTARIRAIRKF